MEQLADGGDRVKLLNGAVAVHRPIAEGVDDFRLAEGRLAGSRLEGRLVDQGAEVVLVRESERGVGFERPGDRKLQCTPRIEAGCARVAVHGRLGPRGSFPDLRPL